MNKKSYWVSTLVVLDIYNHFLNERKEQYKGDKKTDNYYAEVKTLTELKKKEDTVYVLWCITNIVCY
tara:strand:- start:1603 stop:1803 length:201 start_codon:yes stop_codon:yes gene_type:complete